MSPGLSDPKSHVCSETTVLGQRPKGLAYKKKKEKTYLLPLRGPTQHSSTDARSEVADLGLPSTTPPGKRAWPD